MVSWRLAIQEQMDSYGKYLKKSISKAKKREAGVSQGEEVGKNVNGEAE